MTLLNFPAVRANRQRSSSAAKPLIRFGAFELDGNRKELRRSGKPVSIQPRVLRLLSTLAEHRPNVVTKEELLDVVWPNTTVSETTLLQAVRRARKAVGDDGQRQEIIETVPGHGFRFVANTDGPVPVTDPGPGQRADADQGFVGREEELRQLRNRLEMAAQGQGQLIHITGPAGIGKTRLVEQLPRLAREETEIHAAFCYEEARVHAFWPFVQLLRQLLGAQGLAATQEMAGRDAAWLGQLLPELTEGSPLSSVPAELGEEGGSLSRFMLLEAITNFLFTASRRMPLVLLIEDVQWADEASLAVLSSMSRRIARSSLTLLVTGRTDTDRKGRDRSFDRILTAQSGVCLLPLAGLRPSEASRLLLQQVARRDELRQLSLCTDSPDAAIDVEERPTSTVGSADGLTKTRIEELVERAEGNPLYLLQLASDPSAIESELPAGVVGIVQRRLEALREADRALLELASVIGRRFALSMLIECSGLLPDQVAERVDALSEEGWIREVHGEIDLFEFVHALHHESLYSALAAMRRRNLHLQVLQWLQTRPSADSSELALELASHSFRAAPLGDGPVAVGYQVAVAEKSMASGLHDEAVECYGRALQLLRLTPNAGGVSRAELLCRLGQAQTGLGRLGDATESFDRAEEEARQNDDVELVARIALAARPDRYSDVMSWSDSKRRDRQERALRALSDEHPVLRARLLAQLALASCYSTDETADPQRATQLAKEAVEIAEAVGGPADLAACRLAQYLCAPDRDKSTSELDELLGLAQRGGETPILVETRMLRLRHFLSQGNASDLERELRRCRELCSAHHLPRTNLDLEIFSVMQEGRLSDAARVVDRCMELSQATGNPKWSLTGVFLGFLIRREQLRIAEVEAQLRAPLQATNHIGLRFWLLRLLLDEGRVKEAQEELARFAEHPELRDQSSFHWLVYYSAYAEFCALLGKHDALAACRETLEPFSGQHVVARLFTISVVPIDYVLGMVTRALGDIDAAVDYFERARGNCEDMQASLWAARCQAALGAALRERGAGDDAERAAALMDRALRAAVENDWPWLGAFVDAQRSSKGARRQGAHSSMSK